MVVVKRGLKIGFLFYKIYLIFKIVLLNVKIKVII